MPHLEPFQKDKAVAASRRWLNLPRFRLRTLFALMVVVAVCLGWWSHRARQQRVAVAAFKHVSYDFEEQRLTKPPYWPAWLVEALGVDYFASVTELTVSHLSSTEQVTVFDWRHLNGLKALKRLDLSVTDITDEGLEHITGLTALETLYLGNTQVTDEGVEHLKALTALRTLDLSSAHITDEGLEHLSDLSALESLDLRYTQVTDARIARLKKALPNCEILK